MLFLSSLFKVDTLFVVQIGRRKDIKSINLTMMIKKETSLYKNCSLTNRKQAENETFKKV